MPRKPNTWLTRYPRVSLLTLCASESWVTRCTNVSFRTLWTNRACKHRQKARRVYYQDQEIILQTSSLTHEAPRQHVWNISRQFVLDFLDVWFQNTYQVFPCRPHCLWDPVVPERQAVQENQDLLYHLRKSSHIEMNTNLTIIIIIKSQHEKQQDKKVKT